MKSMAKKFQQVERLQFQEEVVLEIILKTNYNCILTFIILYFEPVEITVLTRSMSWREGWGEEDFGDMGSWRRKGKTEIEKDVKLLDFWNPDIVSDTYIGHQRLKLVLKMGNSVHCQKYLDSWEWLLSKVSSHAQIWQQGAEK